MFKIIYLIICLAILSYKDIRSRTVPVMWLILMGAVIPVMYVCDYKAGGEIIQYSLIVLSIIIAIIFILLSVFTPLIGEADGIIIGYVCLLSDVYIAVFTVLISFIMLAVSGGIWVAAKKMKIKTAVPYIPFLLSAYMLTLFCI